MTRKVAVAFLAAVLACGEAAELGARTRYQPRHLSPDTRHSVAVPRDRQGRIRRSASARREFERQHTCPATGRGSGACPGWIVDHVVPLACGGADTPLNMQWQTREAARAKDKVERRGC